MQNYLFHKIRVRQRKVLITIALLLSITISCNKFVEVPPPVNKITTKELFKDEANATSAILGIYSQIGIAQLSIANGATTVYTGLASDELNYISSNAEIKSFQTNTISGNNYPNQNGFWTTAYKLIYQANASIEGLYASDGISQQAKNQLTGECKVVRCLLYFYLIQLYGKVPLITTSDYNTTSTKERTATNDIYEFIVSDLKEAQHMLKETYPSTGRARPNLYTASALLSRVYLFQGNWQQAEKEATNIINHSLYKLESDLSKVFLTTSKEAIWQLASVGFGINTREGATFIKSHPQLAPDYLITDQLLNAFEPNDPRKATWVGIKTLNNKIYHFPFKYQVPLSGSVPITESYMVFRLAEQYLIRAEAKIRQGKTAEGISDLNTVRKRARGSNETALQDLPAGASQDIALSYLIKERRIELMAEWGSRWLDLKRFHIANAVLSPIKSAWKDTDTLFPIPTQEILLNSNLTQNPGYN